MAGLMEPSDVKGWPRGKGMQVAAYRILCATTQALEDREKMFGPVTRRDCTGDKPPLEAAWAPAGYAWSWIPVHASLD
jgi:hypothetical protein